MKTYKIPCTWEVCGVLHIDADSLEEAKRIAIEESPLPKSSEYIDGTFEINEDMINYYNK